MGNSHSGRRRLHPGPDWVELWAVEWSDGSLSVLASRGAAEAGNRAKERVGRLQDGWPERAGVTLRALWPVAFLEVGVASRRQLNAPRTGRIQIAGNEIRWSGPHPGLANPSRGSVPRSLQALPERALQRFPCGIWSYVWNELELVLFSAPDWEAAVRWARRSGLGEARSEDIEPVERIELQLAPDRDGYAPCCYRVWIEGYKVGWPPTDSQQPRPGKPSPSGPLHAEARLPIPAYDMTYAYAPGHRPGRRRLFDLPWPDAS